MTTTTELPVTAPAIRDDLLLLSEDSVWMPDHAELGFIPADAQRRLSAVGMTYQDPVWSADVDDSYASRVGNLAAHRFESRAQVLSTWIDHPYYASVA